MLTRSFLPNSSKDLLAYSPMLHSRLFSNTPKYRAQNFEPLRGDTWFEDAHTAHTPSSAQPYLDGHPTHDRPLVVQFCSNSPEDWLAAAKLVEPYCDAVDLNLGCPQGIARRGHYGAFLQEDWDLIYKLINRLHNELSIPVTAKFRVLETKEKTLEYAKMILSAGASIITVHGRQRDQKGHKTGLADWTILRYLREQLPPDTVIFANGNVLQHGDLKRCLDATGADGVMSAEANLSDPTVFATPPPPGQEGREYWRGRDGRGGFRMDAVLRRYIDIIYEHVVRCEPPKRKPLFVPSDLERDDYNADSFYSAEPPTLPNLVPATKAKPDQLFSINLRVMQSHFFHLLRPLVAKHTEIRDKLAKCRAGDLATFEEILLMVERAVMQGILDEQLENVGQEAIAPPIHDGYPEEEATATTSEAAMSRCKRPWFICQSHIRPLPEEALAKGALTLSKKEKAKLEQDAGNAKAAGLHPGGIVIDVPLAPDTHQRIEVGQEAMVSG